MADKALNNWDKSIVLDKSIDTSWRKNKDLYRLFFKSLKAYKSLVFNIIFIFSFLGIIEVVFPFVVQKGFENLLAIRSWQNFYFYSGIILILLAIRFCFEFLEQYLTINFATFFANKIKKVIFADIANKKFTHINNVSPGHLMAKISFNTNLIKTGLEQWGLNLIKQVIFLIGLLIFSLFLSKQFFLITLGVMPIMILCVWAIHRSMRHYINNLQTKNAQITEQLYDLFQSWNVIKLFRLEEESTEAFNHYIDEDQYYRVRRNIIYSIANLLIFIFSTLVSLGLAGLMLKMYLAGETGYTDILLYIFYVAYLARILTQSLRASTFFESIKIGIITTFRFLPPNLKISKKKYGKNEISKGKIEFKNVNFFFPGSAHVRFKKISASLPAGSKILITGEPESGKSCLLHLVTGMLKPVGGKILIDNHEFATLSKESLKQEIGYLSADQRFFEGSIFSNIFTHKKPSLAGSDEVRELIDKIYDFGTTKWASKYKNRLGTKISNQTHLSHNETLLLIAMTALKSNPKIILMDNFFAGADTSLQETVKNYLKKHCPKSTVIYTDYKENDYFKYDNIFHLEHGKLL